MPELPEVETVARDLRPKLVGATIVGARTNWVRTLRSQDPVAFADGVVGRSGEGGGRRGAARGGLSAGRPRPGGAAGRGSAGDPSQDGRSAFRGAGRLA